MSEEESPFNQSAEEIATSSEPYTDLDQMPFGKFKGNRLQDVDASYLLWLWQQRPITDKRLQQYIKKNLRALAKECPDFALDRRDLED